MLQKLIAFPLDQPLDKAALCSLLDQSLSQLAPQQRTHILDAAAIAAYHALMEFPVVRGLPCDDAPQFRLITEQLGLCCLHDRITGACQIPRLPDLLTERAAALNLGASWGLGP